MNFVIGSGPSGVSAAVALLKRNLPVTMIDAGIELEKDKQEAVERMRSEPHEQWDKNFINQIKAKVQPDTSGVPVKYVFGSDFHIRDIDRYILDFTDGPHNYSSLARGGLSNVWGGAILPYSASDLSEWPLRVKDLELHYREVLNFIPISAASDDLAGMFPLYKTTTQDVPMSRQAKNFLDDLGSKKTALQQNDFLFGKSRLALHAEKSEKNEGCISCGLCMYGCPYSLIYNSIDTLDELLKNPNFKYVSGVVVERLMEKDGQVHVFGVKMTDQSSVTFQGEKVFLAGGVLNTAKIILTSMGEYERVFEVKTSQHFVLPLLRFKAVAGVISERLHTLSQVFIEILDRKSPAGNCHLQVYTFNDLFLKVIKEKAGKMFHLFEGFIERTLLSRLLITQGYLSSHYSPSLRARLDRSSGKVTVTSVKNPRTTKKLSEIVRKLARLTFSMKAFPLIPFLRISHGGVGAHIGATFPMKKSPGEFETDLLGRLPRYKSIHMVDASVFTDIPPSTVTLTAMANAHRIASEA